MLDTSKFGHPSWAFFVGVDSANVDITSHFKFVRQGFPTKSELASLRAEELRLYAEFDVLEPRRDQAKKQSGFSDLETKATECCHRWTALENEMLATRAVTAMGLVVQLEMLKILVCEHEPEKGEVEAAIATIVDGLLRLQGIEGAGAGAMIDEALALFDESR